MKKLPKKIIDIMDIMDWTVHGVYEQNGEYYVEIESYSPAGENLVETIWYNGTTDSFIENLWSYAHDFDPDEHAEMWVESRGKQGVPSTIRELVEDADAIQKMLVDLATKTREAYKK